MRRFILLLLLMGVMGCSYNPITNPSPLMLDTEVDYGPPEFRQAYHDGCQTAISAYGTSYQKGIYGIAKSPQYQNSQIYRQVWKDAWNYCYMWIFAQRSQQDESPL